MKSEWLLDSSDEGQDGPKGSDLERVVLFSGLERREPWPHVMVSETMPDLQGIRKYLLSYFGSSKFWTAWNWVKSEWLLD